MNQTPRRTRNSLTLRLYRRRKLWAALAALPLFQATGCFPDPLGALSFELQSLINATLITMIDTVIRNLLGL